MREIQFRGKRLDNTRWEYGCLYTKGDYAYIIPEYSKGWSDNGKNPDFEMVQVWPESVGQYTDQNDNKGMKVYEGDVVKENYSPLNSDPKIIEYYKEGVVVWSGIGFGIQLKIEGSTVLNEERKSYYHKTERKAYKHPTAGKNWVDYSIWFHKLEIIGNIHDNPELIAL